jgi:DNA-binding LacI/PurR family transcriptional regulator
MDFGIITFDKYPVVEMSLPRLTTIDIDVLLLGESAAVTLLKNIELDSKAVTVMNLPVELSARESTRATE